MKASVTRAAHLIAVAGASQTRRAIVDCSARGAGLQACVADWFRSVERTVRITQAFHARPRGLGVAPGSLARC